MEKMERKRQRLTGFCHPLTMPVFLVLCLLTVPLARSQSSGSSADLTFSIVEEQPVGTFIGSITETQQLYKNLTSSQRKQLRYGLLDQSRYPANMFRVEETTGNIYVAKRMDRESEQCFRQPSCAMDFNVALSSPRIPFSNIATVRVEVVDKNDNAPYFPGQGPDGGVELEVSEQTPVGTVLKVGGAVDRDHLRNNSIQRYVMTAYTSVFSIAASTNLDGSSVLDVTLRRQLDRESNPDYRFSILALDGGSPPLSAALAVLIRVTDENDNAPVFLNSSYHVDLKDEVLPGQVILQVSANDVDSGPRGQVRYQFSGLQSQQLEQKFHLDDVTGDVRLVSQLTSGLHQFIVEAVDGGSPPLKSQTVVTVKVVSSRNNPPSLNVNTLSNGSNAFVEIPEDAGPGAFVAFVTAEDGDDGERGRLTCRLDNSVLRLEALAGKGYTLTLRSPLDRERRDVYNVTVTCSDHGSPPLTASQALKVVVTDVNDNPPSFTWSTFSHLVPEGNYSRRHVIQVTATDPDLGMNSELLYTIERSARPLFQMDPVTGIVSAMGQLDRESHPLYSFRVFAEDRGPGPKTATATVVITLEDVNDQYPTFNQTIFEYRIPEDAPPRSLLGTLSAYDLDAGKNGQFEFFYAGSLDGADPFLVSTNGSVWSSNELDRERRDSYSFTVMVRDLGVPPKTTYASVVVTVLDVNDNAPTVRFPIPKNYTVPVSSSPESGMVLAKIVAYDPDAAENGSLHFLILSGNEDGALDIDASGGEVKVVDVSRLRNRKVYRLLVAVRDYGMPPRETNTTILVDVDYDNSSGVLTLGEGESQEEGDDYIIIVAGVAGTTVVLSAIIIVAICFIFRQERQYRSKRPATGGNRRGDDDFFTGVVPPLGNLCDDEKLRPSLEEEGDEKHNDDHHHHTTSFNTDDDGDDGVNAFKMKQMAMDTFRNSQRKKEVSFASSVPVAEEGGPVAEAGSPMSHTYRNVSTGGGAPGDKVAEINRHHHHHQLLARQIDEVGSDTSGDTGTSDSGRGGSEDDVNVDSILHGERQAVNTGAASSQQQQQQQHQHQQQFQSTADSERYSRFPQCRNGPRTNDPHKPPLHVRFDTTATNNNSNTLPYHHQHHRESPSSPSSAAPALHSPRSRPTTPSSLHHHHHDSAPGGRTVTFSLRGGGGGGERGGSSLNLSSPGAGGPPHPPPTSSSSSSMFLPGGGKNVREAPFSSSSYKDVSFTALPQHSPVRTLSTFSSAGSGSGTGAGGGRPPVATFSTFRKASAGPPPPAGPLGSASGGGGGGRAACGSMDDDASTTTSGSYTLNPEELRVDGYIGSDVIV